MVVNLILRGTRFHKFYRKVDHQAPDTCSMYLVGTYQGIMYQVRITTEYIRVRTFLGNGQKRELPVVSWPETGGQNYMKAANTQFGLT